MDKYITAPWTWLAPCSDALPACPGKGYNQGNGVIIRMSFASVLLNLSFGIADFFRDLGVKEPPGIFCHAGIDYAGDGLPAHRMDLNMPATAQGPLPVIVSVHGGGWVYGGNGVYRHYCARLAAAGFAVLNINYRLAPKYKFPAALQDLNAVFHWIDGHASDHGLDRANLFVVGDSAGAQIACQYLAALSNPVYASRFPLQAPAITVSALACICGLFDPLGQLEDATVPWWNRALLRGLMGDLFGDEPTQYQDIMSYWQWVGPGFPPVFIANSLNDLLVGSQPSILPRLAQRSVQVVYKEYGKGMPLAGHVFHLNPRSWLGAQLNNDTLAFFRNYIK